MSDDDKGSWPTQEQFDQAATHGTEYALQEIANGNIRPLEHPLGGLWADGMSERKVAANVGFKLIDGETDEAQVELGNAWENAYFDVWRSKGADG